MIIDAHIHLFTPAIVANVSQRRGLVAQLRLQTQAAPQRLGLASLATAMQGAGVDLALHLPTANAAGVANANERALAACSNHPFLATAGTLHPRAPDIPGHLARLKAAGVRAIKLCSFSQGFALDGGPAQAMWAAIETFNRQGETPFFVVLDTYYGAAEHFVCAPEHVTTPARLAGLVRDFAGIRFVGAHMGGLGAPEDILLSGLPAAPNLYLDTSNAAHTLSQDGFLKLLKIHGPEHILFGTDWPWFDPGEEIGLIDGLLKAAGFSKPQRSLVFGKNAAHLLGLIP
jgi:predicted TIM-barrel fold metal-dependent hydrolase